MRKFHGISNLPRTRANVSFPKTIRLPDIISIYDSSRAVGGRHMAAGRTRPELIALRNCEPSPRELLMYRFCRDLFSRGFEFTAAFMLILYTVVSSSVRLADNSIRQCFGRRLSKNPITKLSIRRIAGDGQWELRKIFDIILPPVLTSENIHFN